MFFIDPASHEIGRSPSSAPASFTPSVRWGIGVDADDFRAARGSRAPMMRLAIIRQRYTPFGGAERFVEGDRKSVV
jgi:hypothetical protein